MAIDAKDHRRFAEGKLAEANKLAAEKVAERELLQQAASAVAVTGDDKLDKLVRAVQALLDVAEGHVRGCADKGIACVQEEMVRLAQFEYFYSKGKAEAFKEVMQIPARIITEAKTPLELVP